MVVHGGACEGQQTVYLCHQMGVALQRFGKLLQVCNKLREQPVLQGEDFLLGTHYLLLILLQFLSDISLSLCQCLFSYPLRRHLVLICVAYLKVVAEDVVEAYLQRTDTRAAYLTLLYLKQVVLA